MIHRGVERFLLLIHFLSHSHWVMEGIVEMGDLESSLAQGWQEKGDADCSYIRRLGHAAHTSYCRVNY